MSPEKGGCVAKLDYRSAPVKRSSSGDVQFGEFVAPLALLVAGLLLYGGAAFYSAGARSAVVVMGIMFLIAAVQTVLGIAAAYITASLLSTGFGELRSAFVKFAGILVFTGAITWIIPYGGLLSLFVYFGLLVWLFGLETYEAAIFAIIFAIIRFIVLLALFALIMT
jgi:hypothetical protein